MSGLPVLVRWVAIKPDALALVVAILSLGVAACGRGERESDAERRGKACMADGNCEGRQRCWCEMSPGLPECISAQDLPSGECVSRAAWDQRMLAKTTGPALQARRASAAGPAAAAVAAIFPRCKDRLALTVSVSVATAATDAYTVQADGTVPYSGKLCDASGNCEEGAWNVALHLVITGSVSGGAGSAVLERAEVVSTDRPLPGKGRGYHKDDGDPVANFLTQACR